MKHRVCNCLSLFGVALSVALVCQAAPASPQEEAWRQALQAGDEALAGRDYDRATQSFQAAWAQAEHFAEADPRRAQTLARLARVYRAQGDFAKPENLYRDALAVAEQAYGRETPDFAKYLNEVGRYFHMRRKHGLAEEYYRSAFGIRVRALGREHPEVGESINNLAILYENQSRYDKADVYYSHALEIREKALGPEHPDTIATLEHFARLLHKVNRGGEAEPLRERAEAFRIRRISETSGGTRPGTEEPYSASAGVRPPRLSENTEPEYTEEARIARHEGTVLLMADISVEGQAGNFRLVRSLGLGLDEKAVEAVRRWSFEPALKGKQRVPFRAVLEINFRVL